MGEHRSSSSSSKHHKSKRSHKDDEERDSKRLRKHIRREKRREEDSDDEWVEKEGPAAVPGKPVDTYGTFTPGVVDASPQVAGANRLAVEPSMTDGFGEGDTGGILGGGEDMFSSMGTERKRKEPVAKPDPSVTILSDACTELD